jgi:hypothetical protein
MKTVSEMPTCALPPCVWPGCKRLLTRGANSQDRWERERGDG